MGWVALVVLVVAIMSAPSSVSSPPKPRPAGTDWVGLFLVFLTVAVLLSAVVGIIALFLWNA